MTNKIHSAVLALILSISGAAGCSASSPPGTGGSDAGGPDLAQVIPMGCSVSLVGTLTGRFKDCGINMSVDTQDEVLRLVPTKYQGPALTMVLIDAVVRGSIKAKSYALADLDTDTQIVFLIQDQGQRFSAGKDKNGVVTGTMKFDVLTPPVQPPGMDTWIDSGVHGVIKATLVHDDNTPGMPGDTVAFDAQF